MSLLWEPKEERMKKIEKLKALANTVDGLPRLLKGVGDEIGKQFHVSLKALLGYQEEQHKETKLAYLDSEKKIMAAVAAVIENQKVEFSEQLQNAQLQTIKSVGQMMVKLDEKLGSLTETGEESRAISFGIAEVLQKTINSLSEGLVNFGKILPVVPTDRKEDVSKPDLELLLPQPRVHDNQRY